MDEPWSKDFSALSTIPGQLYKRIIKTSNSPGLKILNGIMMELSKGTELTHMENLTEILNDGDKQCYFADEGFTLDWRHLNLKLMEYL